MLIDAESTLVQERGPIETKVPAGQRATVPTLTQTVGSLTRVQELSSGAPRTVPGYTLKRKLGRGTFGEVWLAEDQLTQRPVAIKFLLRGAGRNWEAMLEEVRQLARFDSEPSVVHLVAVDRDGDPPCYVMSYADGGSLADRLPEPDARGGSSGGLTRDRPEPGANEPAPLTAAEALDLFRRVAESLSGIHVKGICHCDLKPANILLDNRGRPLIADFGQARFSQDAAVSLGTFFYMAPEQADTSDQRPDLRWDVYSLGAIVFECLTGRAPRSTETLRAELSRAPDLASRLCLYQQRMLASPVPRQHHSVRGVQRDEARVIDRCLEVDPAKRFRDAWGIVAALDRCERRRRARRVRNIALALSGAAVLLISGWAYRSTMKEIKEARTSLIQESKNDFRVIAKLLGKVVGQQVTRSRRLIQEFAEDPQIRDEIGRVPRDAMRLEALGMSFADKARLAGFSVVMIADREGKILLDLAPSAYQSTDPWEVKTLDDPEFAAAGFSSREWFNGRRQEPEWKNGRRAVYEPLAIIHISRPYRRWSSADKEWKVRAFGPAISAPIVCEGRTVGVIAAQIPSETIYEWINELALPGGCAVLLSEGCVVQSHPGFLSNEANPKPEAETLMNEPAKNGHEPGEIRSDCPYCRLRKPDDPAASEASREHRDPVDDQPYIANFAPVERLTAGEWEEIQNWCVVVQKKRDVILQEFNDIEKATQRWWAGAPTVVLGCIVMLWFLSERLLTEKDWLSRVTRILGGALGGSLRGGFDRAHTAPASGAIT